MSNIVKVAIESPLPQLDKLFDYEIPAELIGKVKPGQRLCVPFGKAKKLVSAFSIELAETAETENPVSVASLVSEVSVLTRDIYQLARAVADRQAATLTDVLKLAIPTRSVRVESTFEVREIPQPERFDFEKSIEFKGKRIAFTPVPHIIGNHPGWVLQFVKSAIDNLLKRESTILVVPDYRDQLAILNLIEELGMKEWLVHYSNDQTPSVRYAAFLNALNGHRVILGSRSAIFAPAKRLGSIFVLNDGDDSLFEPTSPYLATREVALIRQRLTDCQLVFASQSRSCEVQRLVELKYLHEQAATFTRPTIAVTDSEVRVDSLAYQTIRRTLESGGSALVQVSSAGTTTALFCQKCSSKLRCKNCSGPVGLDSAQKPKCRWCAAFNLDLRCAECGSNTYRQGRAGVTRTVAEFGRAFPGAKIIEASGEKRITRLTAGKQVVVATLGAEPIVAGGYDSVVLLDAQNALAKDTLRATENAVRQWADAVALLSPTGRAVLVGVSGKLGQQFALWNLNQLAATELAERRELGFPPHLRMASVTAEAEIAAKVVEGLTYAGKQFEILGPQRLGAEARYLIRYEYSLGPELAKQLKARALAAAAGTIRQSKSGRSSRAVRLKIDDAEVI